MGFAELIQRAWRDNILWSVLLELTYRCNLRCFYCYNDLGLAGTPLSVDDYLRLLDELAELQVMNVILSGGEPLAHPGFLRIGGHARARGFAVRIKSNGHALRGVLARRIRDEIDPFVIDVSLHGAGAASHDRQTRVAGSFERLMANLREMRALGLRVKLNATLTRWNEDEIAAMYDLADALELPLAVGTEVTARDDGDRGPLEVAPSRRGVARLFSVQRARAARAELPVAAPAAPPATDRPAVSAAAPVRSGKHCGAGSSSLAVDPVGNVLPCVQWRQPLGNLHDSSIGEIWRGAPGLAAVRRETAQVHDMVQALGEDGRRMAYCPGSARATTGSPLVVHDAARVRAEVLAEHDAGTGEVDRHGARRRALLPVIA